MNFSVFLDEPYLVSIREKRVILSFEELDSNVTSNPREDSLMYKGGDACHINK